MEAASAIPTAPPTYVEPPSDEATHAHAPPRDVRIDVVVMDVVMSFEVALEAICTVHEEIVVSQVVRRTVIIVNVLLR